MNATPLRLKKDQDRRLRFGHCWIYSNEVDIDATPLKGFEPGEPVDIVSQRGKWLGSGYVNPHSLICARLVSRNREHPMSPSLLVERLRIALALRERFYERPFYRLLFGESDGLPGLVIDRYGDAVVIQITTAGMERLRDAVVAAVEEVLQPALVLLRNDTGVREMEGLDLYVETVLGDLPETLLLEENWLQFQIPAAGGQKTGWFYDQAENRARMGRYIQGGRVLDLCSYVGGWGVQAAVHGASDVLCVDTSASALEMVHANAKLNGVGEQVRTLRGDVFDAMKHLCVEQEHFDLVVVDPPAFIKRRKDKKEGALAYQRLNQLAMQLLGREGRLITSSCSFHFPRDELLKVVQQAARRTERTLQLLEEGGQSADHPIHPAIPETAYLKTFYLRVLPSF